MTDERKILHDQVEQTREEDIDCLIDSINRFLNPLESPAPHRIVFRHVPPAFKAAVELEEQRQQVLARLRAEHSEKVRRVIGDAVTRLGIDLNKMEEGLRGSLGSSGKSADFSCSWFEGRMFNRLGTFKLKEQQVVTYERCHISEAQRELIYEVRILTRSADVEKELTVPI